MARPGIIPCQVHAHPVLLPDPRCQIQPREILGLLGQAASIHGHTREILGNGRPDTSGTGMGQQSRVVSRRKTVTISLEQLDLPEFHKVVTTAGTSQLANRFSSQRP